MWVADARRTREACRLGIRQCQGIADIDSRILLQLIATVDLGRRAHGLLNRIALFQFGQPGQPLREGTAAKDGRGQESAGGCEPKSSVRARRELAKKHSRRYHSRRRSVTEGVMIALSELNPSNFTEAGDPVALFRLWLEEATAAEINDPEAMALATVDERGSPDARMVLCKGADARGIVFYSNVESAKGRELAGRPLAAALFHWKALRRQVRFRGPVAELTESESDAYFALRPRGSQIGAWASQQSRPLVSRAVLEAAVEAYERRFGDGEIPRPDYWRGYRLTPVEIEFWRDGPSRLHDRVRFSRASIDAPWERQRLYP